MQSPCTSRRPILALSLLLAALPFAHAKTKVPTGWFVWPVVEPATGSALDASALNPTPAGATGRIAVKDGAFVTPDGRPLRFFGVNLASDDAFPSAEDAELLARRLAKAGVNIVRLHHMDNIWGVGTGGSLWPKDRPERLALDAAQLDKVHRLIAILARHGIYSNINLKVSKTLSAVDGFPAAVAEFPDFQKRVDFFDRRMIELQKDYARRLLTTKNPYTGLAPVDDPAVAIVEINNENSVLGFFTRDLGQGADRFPEPFRTDLQAQWNAWLAGRYADTAALATAWAAPAGPPSPGPVIDPATTKWQLRLRHDATATLTPGPDASAFVVDVTRANGPDWSVQLSAPGLHIADNTVYTVAFEARAASAGTIGVGVANDTTTRPGEEWRSLGLLAQGSVGPEWKSIRLVFPAHSVAGGLATLGLNLGSQPNRIEIRGLTFAAGGTGLALAADQTLETRTIPLPTEPSTRQWADWIAFLAGIDRAFAEEMRAFLRDDLGVKAPMVCSQINFSGLPALDREQSMEFADTHTYWQHPNFPGAGWDRANWTIDNSPMVAVFGPRRFGELGNLAYLRVAGKPFAVSEFDHSAPSEYVCEMYPEWAVFASRQNWDALYLFDFGAYGTRNPDGRITGFFDQINHPAKWSLAPFATRIFRGGLVPPATAVAELRPGNPVWGDAMHFDMLWAALNPTQPFDFLNCRLQVANLPAAGPSSLARRGKPDSGPAQVLKKPLGQVFVAAVDRAAVATGFLGGATTQTGPLTVTCPRFGRDFATVAVIALDDQPLTSTKRALVTIVARAENQGMKWNEARTTIGREWGHGPTIAERVPATIALAVDGPRAVFALKPDGTRAREVKATYAAGHLTFTVSPKDNTLHYELVAK